MLRRTAPAVSFSPSHRALMMRSSRPLLGNSVGYHERYKAAWDEMPWQLMFTSKKTHWEWEWKSRFQLGLRNDNCRTKAQWLNFYLMNFFCVMCFIDHGYIGFYLALFWAPPDHMNADNGRATAQKWGYDVWCADGKFVRPMFHLMPPMYTMKAEDLA